MANAEFVVAVICLSVKLSAKFVTVAPSAVSSWSSSLASTRTYINLGQSIKLSGFLLRQRVESI